MAVNPADSFFGNPSESTPQLKLGYVNAVKDGSDEHLNLFNWLHTRVYAQYMIDLKLDDYYYRQRFGVDLIPKEWQDKGFKPTVPPTAYNSVEAAADHILTTPDIYVPERPTMTDALREQDVAESKRQALDYFWHSVFLMGDPVGKGKKKLIKDGKIVLKKLIKWDQVNPSGLQYGASGFIWSVKVMPNETIYEDPDNPEDPKYVYEVVQVPCAVARRMFPEISTKALVGKNPDDRVRIIECWTKPEDTDEGQRILWLENERVFTKKNPYSWELGLNENGKPTYDGYIPYFIADSGWGDVDSLIAPHERYVGIIRFIRSVIETEARQVTAADAQMRVSTFPFAIFRGIGEDQKVEIKPGARINLPGTKEEQDIEFKTWPSVPDGIWQLIASVHNAANESARFSQLSGMPQRGVDTATEAGQNYSSASAKLQGPIQGIRSMMIRMNRTVLQDVEFLFEAPITLYGAAIEGPGAVTLSPEDIDGFYETYVELKTSDEMALSAARMRQWGDAYQLWGFDKAYGMRMAGIKLPNRRIAARLSEDLVFDPRSHELRMMLMMAGQGALGQRMAAGILQANTGGTPAGESPQNGAGGFPGIPSPVSATPQAAAGQETRATAFGRALEMRPDLQVR
jgi:hypothetical protein